MLNFLIEQVPHDTRLAIVPLSIYPQQAETVYGLLVLLALLDYSLQPDSYVPPLKLQWVGLALLVGACPVIILGND